MREKLTVKRCLLLLVAVLFSWQFKGVNSGQSVDENAAEKSLADFDVHDDLTISVFAAEPMLVNPANIDIDHLGRVWVCEVVNYRNAIRNADHQERKQGDRILILSDVDRDGRADKADVFYQGRDVDSAHGICVLGNRVLVSAGSDVFYLIDDDGDLKSDRKELLFTGISGKQHDHGIHAFVFGPDGKLYFNFGNEGRQICDADGKPIVDMAGNVVKDDRQPYQEGMVFRCNLDGSDFETLAWNFRNNWEVCVDSFGGLWQSDNDDDGNRGTRINHVLPFGNYGYREEFTGAGWQSSRTGESRNIADRHWHQNDPGVIPNLLNTGAGSPTGICVYEGDLLPKAFRNQLIHCDAGPNIVRAYLVAEQKSGYVASIVDLMDGARRNPWFRPSDVGVAPDGSLMIADWYDPGVGGHRMQDVAGGRIFRMTPEGHQGYAFSAPNFDSIESSCDALNSPNLATRFIAFQSIKKYGNEALPEILKRTRQGALHSRARAYWIADVIQKENGSLPSAMIEAWQSNVPELQKMALRWVRSEQETERSNEFWRHVDWEAVETGTVALELAICLSSHQRNEWQPDQHARLWSQLAQQYRSGDRWLLEALGVGAKSNWDSCLDALLKLDPNWQSNANLREIVWRSRSKLTPDLILSLVDSEWIGTEQLPRYFRALDHQKSSDKSSRLSRIAFAKQANSERNKFTIIESLKRIEPSSISENDREKLNELVGALRGSKLFLEMTAKFNLENRFPELLEFAVGDNRQLAVEAINKLAQHRHDDLILQWVKETDSQDFDKLIQAIRASANGGLTKVLGDYAQDRTADVERRKSVVRAMNRNHSACRMIERWLKNGNYDRLLDPAVSAALHNSPWDHFRKLGQKHFPIESSQGEIDVPRIVDLLRIRGDANNGKTVFDNEGTCAKCHVVNGAGNSVGPELSEIGTKLTRESLFESILFPSAGISHNFETWLILTEEGTLVSGVLVSETEDEIQLRDAENILRKIPVESIESKKKQQLSLMPGDLHKAISKQQLVDVVEYMMTLRKK